MRYCCPISLELPFRSEIRSPCLADEFVVDISPTADGRQGVPVEDKGFSPAVPDMAAAFEEVERYSNEVYEWKQQV